MWSNASHGLHGETPLVSVVVATRDRPALLGVVLECYRRQTYPHRELVVVDDGALEPARRGEVRAAGGRLVRVVPGTPSGTKLNLGLDATTGALCQVMQDAAWYSPTFLATMVASLQQQWQMVYQPTIACLAPVLTLDLPRWELSRGPDGQTSGGTLLFPRECWHEQPFQPLDARVGATFVRDQRAAGVVGLAVRGIETFLAVEGADVGRGGSDRFWLHDPHRIVGAADERVPYGLGLPEVVLPDWALQTYRRLARASAGPTAAR